MGTFLLWQYSCFKIKFTTLTKMPLGMFVVLVQHNSTIKPISIQGCTPHECILFRNSPHLRLSLLFASFSLSPSHIYMSLGTRST